MGPTVQAIFIVASPPKPQTLFMDGRFLLLLLLLLFFRSLFSEDRPERITRLEIIAGVFFPSICLVMCFGAMLPVVPPSRHENNTARGPCQAALKSAGRLQYLQCFTFRFPEPFMPQGFPPRWLNLFFPVRCSLHRLNHATFSQVARTRSSMLRSKSRTTHTPSCRGVCMTGPSGCTSARDAL